MWKRESPKICDLSFYGRIFYRPILHVLPLVVNCDWDSASLSRQPLSVSFVYDKDTKRKEHKNDKKVLLFKLGKKVKKFSLVCRYCVTKNTFFSFSKARKNKIFFPIFPQITLKIGIEKKKQGAKSVEGLSSSKSCVNKEFPLIRRRNHF